MSSGRIQDLKSGHPSRPTPKIVGANEISNTEPQVLDKNTKQEAQEIPVTQHTETITEDSRLRKPGTADPIQVRVHSGNPNWEKIKREDD
jgi:hypothetical protein